MKVTFKIIFYKDYRSHEFLIGVLFLLRRDVYSTTPFKNIPI
jgi:hypothetical protein